MSITLKDWYRQMTEDNQFKLYGDWEINDANLRDLIRLGSNLDVLLEKMEADRVPKSHLLKAGCLPNNLRVVGKSKTSYLFHTKMANESEWEYGIMSLNEAEEFEESREFRRLGYAWVASWEPVLHPVSRLLEWAARLLGYNLT